jgi:lipoyl(octanoyl) transferase
MTGAEKGEARVRRLNVQRLGLVDYDRALELQKRTELAVRDGGEPDTLLLLEHPHTYTLGRRSTEGGVLATPQMLESLGVQVHETNRGGKVTYHGLGQLIGYPIIDLNPDRRDVHRYVRDLEEVLIRTVAELCVDAFRIEGLTGVHTAQGKVAAIGVHIARWVTTHGFALNVNTDLSYFNMIVACEGEPVTSLQRLLGRKFDLSDIENLIVRNFAVVFEREVVCNPVLVEREAIIA